MNGWKESVLSQAGKKVLIKSVVLAIPTYIMDCFLLLVDLCDHVEMQIS